MTTVPFLHAQISPSDSAKYTRQLVNIEQACMNDLGVGSSKNFNKYMHRDCFIVNEDGETVTKQAFVSQIRPLPKGYSGHINVTDVKTVFYDKTAVIKYVADEFEDVFDNKLHTKYAVMNTYVRNDTSWQMVSGQIFEVPLPPPSITLPTSVLQKYTGTYRLSDSVTCTISLRNDTLYFQRIGRVKAALKPETENVFFRAGDSRGRKLFVKNDKGAMVMRERRNGQDVVWEKIK
ncbi:MAG TPA: DUF4440 domain-containing protein [Bacteroidota bacterium]|nr:DUF4440 domain-containing protein [Bacteroidota bacterium]